MTLSDPGATAAFDGYRMEDHRRKRDASSGNGSFAHTPANFVGSETLTVTAHVVDTGNGTQNQSIPVTFNVTVRLLLEPAGTTADMIMRDGSNGNYEIYDIGSNAILAADALGQSAPQWQVAGLGGFDGTDTSDMFLRNSDDRHSRSTTSATTTSPTPSLWAKSDWNGRSSGFGDFSSNAGETDMLMRNSNTGAFEIYDISNNADHLCGADGPGRSGMAGRGLRRFLDAAQRNRHADAQQQYRRIRALRHQQQHDHSAAPMGQVGLEWPVAGFGDFSSNANETDMLMRNNNTGAIRALRYQQQHNHFSGADGPSRVGVAVAGFGPINGAGASDMLMRNNNTGAFELYDISHNRSLRRGRWGKSDWNGRSPGSPPFRRVTRPPRALSSRRRWRATRPPAVRSSLLRCPIKRQRSP